MVTLNCCTNTYSSGSPYSVFNLRSNQQYSECYAQQYGTGQQYGSSARPDSARTACLNVNQIPFPITQVSYKREFICNGKGIGTQLLRFMLYYLSKATTLAVLFADYLSSLIKQLKFGILKVISSGQIKLTQWLRLYLVAFSCNTTRY